MNKEVVIVGVRWKWVFVAVMAGFVVWLGTSWKEEIMDAMGLIARISEGKESEEAWMGVIVLGVICLTIACIAKICVSSDLDDRQDDPPAQPPIVLRR